MSSFPTADILIDNSENLWHDVLLLRNPESTSGIVWWVVDSNTYTLLPNSEFWKYKDAVIWYRLVSESEITDILATPANIYSYTFFGDKTFSDFKVKDFQAEFYNTTDIISIDLSIVTVFEPDLVWDDWGILPKDSLFEVNLNF